MLTAALIIAGIICLIASVGIYTCNRAGSNFDRMLEDARNERPNSDDTRQAQILNSHEPEYRP